MSDLVLWLDQLRMSDLGKVGGKNASLGEMIGHLEEMGVSVPGGFATTAHAFQQFIAQSGLAKRIQDRQTLCERARKIAASLLTTPDARPMDELLELCQRLASVGDSAIAASLAAFADQFDDLNARARPLALQQLTDDCAKLRLLLDQAASAASSATSAARPLSTRVDASTEEAFFSKNEKAARDLFKALVPNPLDAEVIPRKALIKRLELYLKQPFPGVAGSFAAMASHLDAAEHQARRELVELFAERTANRSQLTALVPAAERAAAKAEPIWVDVGRAWQELAHP